MTPPDTMVQPSDVIIVLGAAVWPQGQPSPALRRRVAHAVRLFQNGEGRYVLMTGGVGVLPPAEADVMRQLAIEAGVPDSHIVVEDQAHSTFDSAVYCYRICQQHGWTTALIVTDRYHLLRALLTFYSFGLRVRGSAAHRLTSQRWYKTGYAYGREFLALGWYLWRILRMKRRP